MERYIHMPEPVGYFEVPEDCTCATWIEDGQVVGIPFEGCPVHREAVQQLLASSGAKGTTLLDAVMLLRQEQLLTSAMLVFANGGAEAGRDAALVAAALRLGVTREEIAKVTGLPLDEIADPGVD